MAEEEAKRLVAEKEEAQRRMEEEKVAELNKIVDTS